MSESSTDFGASKAIASKDVFVPRRDHVRKIVEFVFVNSADNALYIQGEGGSGKSWIAREIAKVILHDRNHPSCVANIELNEDWRPEDVLLSLYSGLSPAKQLGSIPPLKRFVFAYLRLMEWRAPGRVVDVRRRFRLSQVREETETLSDAVDVATYLATETIEETGAMGRLLMKGLEYLSDRKLRKEYPELDELEMLPRQQLSLKLEDFFIEDLSVWMRENKKTKVVFIVDNIDALQSEAARQNEKRVRSLLLKICNRCRGAKIIFLGRPNYKWMFPEDYPGKNRVATHVLGELTRSEADELLSLREMPGGELRSAILSGPRVPEFLNQLCKWIRDRATRSGALPSPGDLPKRIDDLYERLLAFRSDDEQVLLRALAHAEKFDRDMLRSLAKRLNLPLTEASFDRIIYSASVVDLDGHWAKFHDLFRDHLRHPPRLDPAVLNRDRVHLTEQVARHLVEDRLASAVDLRFQCALMALNLTRIIGSPWRDPNIQDLVANVLEAISGQVETSTNLDPGLILEALDRVLSLVDDAHEATAEVLSSSDASDRLILALGRIADLLTPLVLEAATSYDPEKTLDFLSVLQAIVRTAASRAVGARAKHLQHEALSLAIHDVLCRRMLPPDYEGDFQRIHTFADFNGQLGPAAEALVSALEGAEAARPGHILIVAIAFGRLSRAVSRGGAGAEEYYQKASHFLRLASLKSGNEQRILLEEARHYLYPIANRPVAVSELKAAIRNLRSLIEGGAMGSAVFQLWIRAQIRTAQKRKDGELPTQRDLWESLDEAENRILQLEADNESYERASRVRLFLRLLRKRSELGAPASNHLASLQAMLNDLAEDLPTISAFFYWPILKELSGAISEARIDGSVVVQAILAQVRTNELSEWRRIQALRFLYDVLDEDAEDQNRRVELLSLIANQPSIEFDPQGAHLKRLAERELADRAIQRLADPGHTNMAQYLLTVSEKFLAHCTDSAVAAAFCAEKIELCRKLFTADHRDQYLSLLRGFERQFLLYCPNDLRAYKNILELKLEVFGQEIKKWEADNNRETLDYLNTCLEAHIEIGSLLYSSIALSRGKRWWQGAQLLFEAMALGESSPHIAPILRQTVRAEFARHLWKRLMRVNDRHKKAESEPPEALLDEFVQAEALTEDIFLRFLCALPIQDFRVGALGVAKLQKAVSSFDPEASEFLLAGQKVLVKHSLLSIRAFHSIFPDSDQKTDEPVLEIEESETHPSAKGKLFLLNLISPQDGMQYGSFRGDIFVSKGLELFMPGLTWARQGPKQRRENLKGVVLGASNSWCVARVSPRSMTSALAGQSVLLQTVQRMLGLRRITLVPVAEVTGTAPNQYEIKHFVNNSWRDLRIVHISSRLVVVDAGQTSGASNPRKLRTFRSMFKKVHPDKVLEFIDLTAMSDWQDEQSTNEEFDFSGLAI